MNPRHHRILTKIKFHLSHPADEGGRHKQALLLVLLLLEAGAEHDGALQIVQNLHDPPLEQREIRSIIRWASENHQKNNGAVWRCRTQERSAVVDDRRPVQRIEQFLKGFRCVPTDLAEASPFKIPEDWRVHCKLLIGELYRPTELVNIVTDYMLSSSAKGDTAKPTGSGCVLTTKEWIESINQGQMPESKAGAWLRANPVLHRTPNNGRGFSDEDIACHRFTLLESDSLPLELQCAFLANLTLPIVALITSGGRSLHALIRLGASDALEYRRLTTTLFPLLVPYGIDGANRNASRLCRLPGVKRQIGGVGDGIQKLIYFSPAASQFESIL